MQDIPRLKKHLGQHILIKRRFLNKIVDALQLKQDQIVLEIGPGTGELTVRMLQRGAKVIAVEKDPVMTEYLKKRFADVKQLSVVQQDILKFSPREFKELKPDNYLIAGNIPYYLTSRLLRILFQSWPPPIRAVLMLQREVARRILAKSPKLNLLAVAVNFFADPKLTASVPKNAFSPVPKVDSAIILFLPKHLSYDSGYINFFFELVRVGFGHKRKFLKSNLSRLFAKDALACAFGELNLESNIRAQELDLDQWLILSRKLFQVGSKRI